MNVFRAAMSLISSIKPPEPIVIMFRTSIFDKNRGVYIESIEEHNAMAHVQPTRSRIMRDVINEAQDSVNDYDIWLVDLTPVIIDGFANTSIKNTQIKIENKYILDVVEKQDCSYNGWIFVKGVQNTNELEESKEDEEDIDDLDREDNIGG